ncbi:hypothetical protein [Pyrobaculum aerophilum]|uniref:Uncharacterized protein n=1 Tax=Pyrobaculum aerophilum TaxID=13773 RepID=A0A371R2Y5_9CREN|nr:hypothetical protein [Pyrobaculum aerophilum]RFA95320.1 hypothetical protein CGL51_07790 [Pyrobaculum aerophilum]RFA98162.1 hypothetical protein CGL52_07855 [Pyrobaculum aerophilum]
MCPPYLFLGALLIALSLMWLYNSAYLAIGLAIIGIAFVTISLAADFDKVKLLICEARSKPIRLATYALHIAAPLLLNLSNSGFLNWFVGFSLYVLLTFAVIFVVLATLLTIIIKAEGKSATK